MKKTLVLVIFGIFLFISSIDCLFNCSQVFIDGNYTKLSVYNKIYPLLTFENIIFNSQGNGWRFTISFDDNKDGIVDVVVDRGILHNETVEKVLGFRWQYYSSGAFLAVSCHLKTQYYEYDLFCQISTLSYLQYSKSADVNHTLNFSHNSVFLRPVSYHPNGTYMLVIDKDNRTRRMKVIFTTNLTIESEICEPNNWVQCPVIPFIDGPTPPMSDQLFKQLDSVVEYQNGSIYGHLLFFTINNRPFYCLQPESQPLSQQV